MGKTILFVPIGAFFIFIFMFLLSSTADDYLSPSLEFLTVYSGMSQSLAGVTLLAFGNGAPDVFSAISNALSTAPESKGVKLAGDNLLACSGLVGGAVFIMTVVQSLVTFAQKPDRKVKVTTVFFIRDLLFGLTGYVYLLVHLLFIGKINLWSTIGFFALYILYVIVVVCTNSMYASAKPEDASAEELENEVLNTQALDEVEALQRQKAASN